jgi:hypothetical protein
MRMRTLVARSGALATAVAAMLLLALAAPAQAWDNAQPFATWKIGYVHYPDQALRQECFWTENRVVMHKWGRDPGDLCGDAGHGGPEALPPVPYGGAQGSVTAALNCQGKAHVYAVGGNGHLYVIWQAVPGGHGPQRGWTWEAS